MSKFGFQGPVSGSLLVFSFLKVKEGGFLTYYYYYYVFILSAISPYTTGLKALFTNPTVQVQPQLTSN